MPTQRKLKCLHHIPSAAVREARRTFQAKQDEWARGVRKAAAYKDVGEDRGRSERELAWMRATGWSATLLFDMPKYLGRDRMHRLNKLCSEYRRAWEDTVWRKAFGKWVAAVEADMAAIARGLKANPRAGYKGMSDAQLKKLIWEKHIRPELPPDFTFEFPMMGPPTKEEAERVGTPRFKGKPVEYFHAVNKVIQEEARIAREVAARFTREVLRAQGFDVLPEFARTWDALVEEEEQKAAKKAEEE